MNNKRGFCNVMEFFLQILLGSKVSLQIVKRIELLIEFRATNLIFFATKGEI